MKLLKPKVVTLTARTQGVSASVALNSANATIKALRAENAKLKSQSVRLQDGLKKLTKQSATQTKRLEALLVENVRLKRKAGQGGRAFENMLGTSLGKFASGLKLKRAK